MKYTAVLFACDFNGSGETLSCSQHVDTDDKATVYADMKDMAHISDEQVDTILVMRNGNDGPEVFHHWTARNGDFEGL